MQPAGGVMRLASLVLVALAIACQLVSSWASAGRDNFDGTLKSEKIFVSQENGTTYGIWIEPGEKVNILQRKIYETVGIWPSRQRLSFGRHSLNEAYELRVYKIKAGSIINLSAWPYDGRTRTNFDVISLARERFPLSTNLSDSVASLKETLAQWTRIPSEQQRLIINGKELEDKRQLLEYDIWNGTSVHMGAPLDSCQGEVKIHLRTLSGATIPVDIELAERVDKLKEKIQQLTGAPTFVQLLMFNDMTLNGPDYLCNYGLESGSRVYLAFLSQQVTDFSLVKQLQPAVEAPIFRETSAEDLAGALEIPRKSVYNDRHNWMCFEYRRHPYMVISIVNPIVYLDPNPDDEGSMEPTRMQLKSSRPDDLWPEQSKRAQYQIATILRPYRAQLRTKGERPGISLGTSWDSEHPLGTNINNFAPDEFADEEIMYLFETSEKVRQQLESDASTGELTLSVAKQKSYNLKLLRAYLEALAGLPLAIENYRAPESEDCAMCRDSLQAEPAFKASCGHGNHIDCALSWILELRKQGKTAMCPYCRAPFRFSFETYVKDEMNWANQGS